jgi:hypothetical protein
MAYRASAVQPKTAWARHLDEVMRTNDWSRVRLFEEVRADLGLGPKSRSAFLTFLDRREPKPHEAEVLAKHFGWPPVESDGLDVPIDGDVVSAIRELTAELRLLREAQTEAPAATAALVAQAIGDTLRALGLGVVLPRP